MPARSKERQHRFMTTGDVAREMGVAVRTVCKWCDSGKLPCAKVPMSGSKAKSSYRRIDPRDFQEFRQRIGMNTQSQDNILLFGQRSTIYLLSEALQGRLLNTTIANSPFAVGQWINDAVAVVLDSCEGESLCLELLRHCRKAENRILVFLIPNEETKAEVAEEFDGLVEGSPIAASIEIASRVLKGKSQTKCNNLKLKLEANEGTT